MNNESCKTCRYWWYEEGDEKGYCRRFPPKLVSDVGGGSVGRHGDFDLSISTGFHALFPDTEPEMWCGEYQKHA